MNKLFPISSTILIGMFSVSCSNSILREDNSIIPAEVAEVDHALYWDEGERTGFVRVSIHNGGFEKVMSKLYIEWIEEPKPESISFKLLKRVRVTELDHMWSMGNIRFERDARGSFVKVEATNTHDHSIERDIIIKVGSIGSYELVNKTIERWH